MAVIQIGFATFSGLGTETKPTTGIGVDTTFYETDTKLTWLFNGTDWILEAGLVPSLNQTPDLPPPFYRWNDKKAGQQKRVKWRDDMGMDWLLKMKPDSSTVLWSSDLAMNGLFTITVSGVGILYWGDGTFDRYSGTDVVLTHTYLNFNGVIYFKGILTKIDNTTVGSDLKHDVGTIPNRVIYYRNEGNNTTTGDTSMITLSMVTYINKGHNTTYGSMRALNPAMTYFTNLGNNTFNVVLGNKPDGIKVINVVGNCQASYTTKSWAANYLQLHIEPNATYALSSTEVDNLITDLSKVTWGTDPNYTKELWIAGNNAARTTASDAAVLSLQAQSVVVTTN